MSQALPPILRAAVVGFCVVTICLCWLTVNRVSPTRTLSTTNAQAAVRTVPHESRSLGDGSGSGGADAPEVLHELASSNKVARASLTRRIVVPQKRTAVTIGSDGTLQYEVVPEGEHIETEQHRAACEGTKEQDPKRYECLTLVQVAVETHFSMWTKKGGWLEPPSAEARAKALAGGLPAHCQWYGITCNENGHVAELYLAQNGLRGTIPEVIQWLPELTGLYLDANQLVGQIPTGLKFLTNLEQWQLSKNKLEGTIPAWVGQIPHLKDLYLSKNSFSGSIPQFRRHSSSVLREVSLDNNDFTGTIPSSLMQHTTLQSLALSHNRLHGPVPDMRLLQKLESLHLENNRLSRIEPGFCELPHELFSSAECYMSENAFDCAQYPSCARGACDDGACDPDAD